MAERRRVIFTGRVQGVGFRATAHSIAAGHPVTGWVRNEPDGSVLLEVQGERESLEGFLGELRATMGRFISSERREKIGLVEGERGFVVAV